MKTDLYTKAVLTVIMICLLIIVTRDVRIVKPLHASPAAAPPSPMETVKVDIVAIDGKTFNALQVSRLGAALPVQVDK